MVKKQPTIEELLEDLEKYVRLLLSDKKSGTSKELDVGKLLHVRHLVEKMIEVRKNERTDKKS